MDTGRYYDQKRWYWYARNRPYPATSAKPTSAYWWKSIPSLITTEKPCRLCIALVGRPCWCACWADGGWSRCRRGSPWGPSRRWCSPRGRREGGAAPGTRSPGTRAAGSGAAGGRSSLPGSSSALKPKHSIVAAYLHCLYRTVRNIIMERFIYEGIIEWNVNKSGSRIYVYVPKVE